MTTPTPAQIEAAAQVIHANMSEETLDLCRDIAKAALTAAAEVGRPDIEYVEGMPVAISAGPAAAEVDRGAQTGKALTGNLNEVSLGENSEVCAPPSSHKPYRITDRMLAEALDREKTTVAATIERCAQVAENFMRGTVGRDYGAEVAAAIRELKNG